MGRRVSDTRAGRGDCVNLAIAVDELCRDGLWGRGGSGKELEAEVDALLGEALVNEVAVAVANRRQSVTRIPKMRSRSGFHTFARSWAILLPWLDQPPWRGPERTSW